MNMKNTILKLIYQIHLINWILVQELLVSTVNMLKILLHILYFHNLYTLLVVD